jgi:gliding motility-associated protein GldE
LETEPSHIFDWYQFTPILLTELSYSGMILNAISICFLLVCSGLLSGSEVAFFSLGHQDKAQLIEEQSNIATRIINLLNKPRYLLSTILIANNVINIAIILVSSSLLNQLLPPNLSELLYMPIWMNEPLTFLISVVAVTFLLVLFGEVAPKVYANQNSMKIARLMSGPLTFMGRLFKGISWILVNSTQFVEQRLRDNMNQKAITQEDIASAIELTVKDNKYAKQDVDILKGIIRFGNTSAAEIMKPRMKVVAMPVESTFEELIAVFREEPYSRIPIYEEDLDKVKGIIHAKDLLEYLGREDGVDWHDLIRPPLITPEKKKIDHLFNDFQEKRTHMAIVVDEYGGTRGIVTMEDILEEIVGEILDEFDDVEEKIYKKIDDYTYDFDGSTPILEICRILDLHPDFFDDLREGAETIAGLVLVLNGAMPKVDTVIMCKDCQLKTLAANTRRIEKIRIVLPETDNIDLLSSVSEK